MCDYNNQFLKDGMLLYYNHLISSILFINLSLLLQTITVGRCSQSGYQHWPISQRVINCDTRRESTPIQTIVSILQAYSSIALVASESDDIPEDDRRIMLIIHELLNGLVQNYFDLVSTCN